MRISSNIASGENFYTDLNGFQVTKFYSSRKTETLKNLFRWFEGSDIQNYLYKQTFIPCQVWDMYKMRSPGDHFSNKYFRKANIIFFSGPIDKNFEHQALFGVKPTLGRDQRCQWSDWGECSDFVILSMVIDKSDISIYSSVWRGIKLSTLSM